MGIPTKSEINEQNQECASETWKLAKWGLVYIYQTEYTYTKQAKPGNCRPILLAQIIYEIWSGLITRKFTKITHILTRNNQSGYKPGISTTDAIVRIEQYIEQANRDGKILMVPLSKPFGAIYRTLIWEARYKPWIPEEMAKRIRRRNQGARLAPKYKGDTGNT